jgi:hypothetical protein
MDTQPLTASSKIFRAARRSADGVGSAPPHQEANPTVSIKIKIDQLSSVNVWENTSKQVWALF